ncbi:MAG: response regulator transcription factor [Cyclobacteriaceae bacterium]
MEEKFRIVLVDDHQMFLDGLSMILSSDASLEVVGTFEDASIALHNMESLSPDLIVTDMNMPEMDGLALTRRAKAKYPHVKILVLSMHKDRETVSGIINSEADGFILKNSNKSELIKAIKNIGKGGTYYSNEIMPIIMQRYQKLEKIALDAPLLSEREKEVVTLIAQEFNNDQIAEKLYISKRTVETHRKNMMSKTGVSTTVGLLKYAVRHEIIAFG